MDTDCDLNAKTRKGKHQARGVGLETGSFAGVQDADAFADAPITTAKLI